MIPDVTLEALAIEDVKMLVLPGGDMWERAMYPRAILESLITGLVAAEIPVAAICAGTLALGRAGVLNARRHTSNMRT